MIVVVSIHNIFNYFVTIQTEFDAGVAKETVHPKFKIYVLLINVTGLVEAFVTFHYPYTHSGGSSRCLKDSKTAKSTPSSLPKRAVAIVSGN